MDDCSVTHNRINKIYEHLTIPCSRKSCTKCTSGISNLRALCNCMDSYNFYQNTQMNKLLTAMKPIKQETHTVLRIHEDNGAEMTRQAFHAEKEASIAIAKIITKLMSEGWTTDQCDYLVNSAIQNVRTFRCCDFKGKELIKRIKRDKHRED